MRMGCEDEERNDRDVLGFFFMENVLLAHSGFEPPQMQERKCLYYFKYNDYIVTIFCKSARDYSYH